MRVVLTGGAGHIGSHVAIALRDAGHDVFALDDLSGGPGARLPPEIRVEIGDVTAPGRLDDLAARARADALIHLAGRIQVGESIDLPLRTYGTNLIVADAVASEPAT
jgi:UDP-glucose 4-epimerase